jgi:uncharacterized membrane protein YkvI
MSKKAYAVAMAYAGAVIGAGFATGREVVDFFSVYGARGLAGIVLATFLFMWAGVVILDVTHRFPVYSYYDLLSVVLPWKWLVTATDFVFLATLQIGIGVMTAGGGAVLQGWGLPPWIGCAGFLLLCALLLRAGGEGFIKTNCWLVPGMTVAIIVLCLAQASAPALGSYAIVPFGSALLYVSFNTAIAGVAMSTLKNQLHRYVVLLGGLGGGLLIGLLLLVIYIATLGMDSYEIPMLRLAEIWLARWQWVYALVLLAAMLTTALANLHGLASRIAKSSQYWFCVIYSALLGFIIARHGFASLVGMLYPLLGLCNIVLLAGLCYYNLSLFKLVRRNR